MDSQQNSHNGTVTSGRRQGAVTPSSSDIAEYATDRTRSPRLQPVWPPREKEEYEEPRTSPQFLHNSTELDSKFGLEEEEKNNYDPNVFAYAVHRESSTQPLAPKQRTSFWYQLGATIKRILLLQTREPVSFGCELLIPIIFVAGSMILWAIFGNDYYPDQSFFSQNNVDYSNEFYSQVTSRMCYNSSVTNGAGIGNLRSCDELKQLMNTTSDDIICAGAVSGAPLGLCGLSSVTQLTYYGWKKLLHGNSAHIPTLDQIIPVQWVNRILYDTIGVSSISEKTIEAAMFSSGKLYFAPRSAATADLVSYLNRTSVFFRHTYAGTVDTIEVAEQVVKTRTSHDPPNWGIIEVGDLSDAKFDVTIHLNATAIPTTKRMLERYYTGGLGDDTTDMYIFSGFTTLQLAIYQFYLTEVKQVTYPASAPVAVPMPTAAYREQKFLAYGGELAPLILVLGFLYPVSQMTKRIVVDKELRLREAMLIMGLPEVVMYLSWLIVYLVQYLVVSLIIAMMLKVTYTPNSNYGIIFFLIFFFCLSIVTLSGLIAAFFNKSRLAAILAPLIYFALAIPLFAMQDAKGATRTGIMMLSPSGLAVGISTLFVHELSGGLHGSDLQYFRDTPTILVVLVMVFCDFLLYMVLMLYVDAVLPKQWGTTKHPLFFVIDPVKWCFSSKNKAEEEISTDGRAPNGVFEPVDDQSSHSVQIVGLRKAYGHGKHRFLAVNNLHWSMREGDISVLLGHNGAGKSTTMNMMTGMIEADAGDCVIYGKSIRYNLAEARQQIGFCPQHNILWPLLTCREHLDYFASIKGLRGEAREAAIERMLRGVDLMDKADNRSKQLSGGQKRKLSVAIAFVGGSRLVFLDEPTAGMDVGARRHTWGLLREMSAAHSILLSTHFMDEADLLGDTVAIMSKGRLQCCGSNLFLKSKLGVGYVLTMSIAAHANRQPIADLVRSHVAHAEQLGSGAGEAAFRLPIEAKGAFSDLLAAVETKGGTIGIKSYSIAATTLEEIFLSIAKGAEEAEAAQAMKAAGEEPNAPDGELKAISSEGRSASSVARDQRETKEPTEVPEDAALVAEPPADNVPSDVWNVELLQSSAAVMMSQFKAMMVKRFWNVLRDRRTQFFQIVCPVLCVLLAMLLRLVKLFQSPAIVLSSDLYETPVVVDIASCNNYINRSIPLAVQAEMFEPEGVTTTSAMSRHQLATYYNHDLGRERYGGMLCADPSLPATSPSLLYNSSTLHEAAIGLYNLYNAFYMNARGDGQQILQTTVSTMPQTDTEKEVTSAVYAMIIAIIIMIPFTFIPSTFVAWVVKERECKARHLQNVSGLFFSIYWLTNFLFDIACYLITMFLVIIVFAIFNRKEYIAPENAGATIVLFLLYGLSGVAMAYAVSFFFREHSGAQNTVMLANFIAGFLLVLCITMLSIIDSTKNVAKVLRWIFRIVPSYCVGEGISNLAVLQMEKAYGSTKTSFSMSVAGWPCVYMAFEFPLFVFVTLFIDHPSRRQRAKRLFNNAGVPPEELADEDPDVVEEREAVLHDKERAGDLVQVRHLRKVYGNGKVAVRNVTLGVKPGEVFGFLGTNGAGKTTVISILCQELYPTSGYAAICGHDIVKDSRQALRYIGYCPQFDATLDLLTVEEHLWLYAGVRAIAYAQRQRVVSGLLKLCELTDYRSTKSNELSGGNRRKLSVALSLIGGPRVVFLDEPSAGMDPVARRGLWTAVETVADNCSVVLTTHHLEEVEALAHRVAIMVDGTLRCIGDKTHLKNKYGSGFEVNLRIANELPGVKAGVEKFFEDNFPMSSVREYRARRYTYELPAGTKLSQTFRLLEENAAELQVTDYQVSQTSIEQVFLQISEAAERQNEAENKAKEQEKREREAAKSGCCPCCC